MTWALGLAACGAPGPRTESSPCVRLSRVDWREKLGTCAALFQPRATAQGVCEMGLGSCGEDDVERLDALAACQDALPSCRPGLEAPWLREVAACDALVATVGQRCRDALPELHQPLPRPPASGLDAY